MIRYRDSLNVVRALAITLVVANHAGLGASLHGGLNVLMLVSGAAMASFSLQGDTAHTLAAMRRFTLRIAVPSFVLALLWGLAVGRLHWLELAFVSNWFYKFRVVLFPIWYPQVIVQMMLFFALVFWLFDLTPKFAAHPVRSAMLSLGLSMAVCLGSYAVWDTDYLSDKLPHLAAWNFVLGWVYWALVIRGGRTTKGRLLFSATLIVCEWLVFELAEAAQGDSRIVWLTAFGLLLVWFDRIPLPAMLAHAVALVGQSTFYIFILHYYGFWAVVRVARLMGYTQQDVPKPLLFVAGMVLPVLVWAGVTAVHRTWVARQRLRPALAA
jgi:hypothetical protein